MHSDPILIKDHGLQILYDNPQGKTTNHWTSNQLPAAYLYKENKLGRLEYQRDNSAVETGVAS